MSHVYEEFDPGYAQTCSDMTLYSNPKGFFKTLAEEMVTLASAGDWLEKFKNAKGDSAKLSMVLENKELMEALTEVLSRIEPLHRGKDGRVCQLRRQEAQQALDQGDVTKALALASQSVLKAPMTGELELVDAGVSLALSLWLRSEVLLKAGRPRAALEDLKLALKERLPAKMRAQYYWRMGHCYKGCGEPTRAKVSYELAARLLGQDDETRQQLAKDIETLADIKETKMDAVKKEGVTLTAGVNQNIPALSKLVKIAEDEIKGRYAVASSPIKTGDVLLIENPYAACLLADRYGTHCLHCFKRLEECIDEAPMWCPKCSGVAFCSTQCRDIAVSTYHTYECQFLDLFIGSGMSILSYIALRMVTQAGLETSISIHLKYLSNEVKTVEGVSLNDIEGLAKKSKIKNRKERLNRTKRNLKSFDKIVKEENEESQKNDETNNFQENLDLKSAQIYSLCTHSDQRCSEDYLKRIIMSMFLTECLKKSAFFIKSQENFKKHEKAIFELILYNLQLLQFNAHELYETIRGKHLFSGSKAVYIAVGIYPTGALFNHECYPAVARYFDGRKIVLRATRPLSPGEVVSENYGPHFLLRSLKERQRSLGCRYWFRCSCTACTEDWPTLKKMSNNSAPFIRCGNKKCSSKYKFDGQSLKACVQCATPVDKQVLEQNKNKIKLCGIHYKDGASQMDEESAEKATAILCSAVDMFHEVAYPPHRETHIAQEALRSCFAVFGNVHEVQNFEEKS